jgi:hypothetical protein
LKYNHLLVGLPDLALTICKVLGDFECNEHGVNLLSVTQDDINNNKNIFIDVVESKNSFVSFKDHKTILLDRSSDFSIIDLLKKNNQIIVSE